MTVASRKTKSDRRRTRKILVTQVKRGKYCEGVVYTYGDFQAELREPRARFTEPCSRYREACSSFRSLMCFPFLCFFNVSVAWGSLGEPKTFIFLCMFKVSVASGRLRGAPCVLGRISVTDRNQRVKINFCFNVVLGRDECIQVVIFFELHILKVVRGAALSFPETASS